MKLRNIFKKLLVLPAIGLATAPIAISSCSNNSIKSIEVVGQHIVVIREYLSLSAKINPEKAQGKKINWVSSNPEILKFITEDDNVATFEALTEGTTTVVAQSAENPSIHSEPFTVNVVYKEPTSISISGESEILGQKAATFTATVLPEQACQDVIWSINTTQCVDSKIDSNTGLFTAGIIPGDVEIVATSARNPEVSISHSLTVKSPLTTKIDIQATDGALINSFIKCQAEPTPSTAKANVVWSLYDPDSTGSEIDQDGVIITGTYPGVITVFAKATDGSEVVGQKQITIASDAVRSISIEGEDTVSIQQTVKYNATVLPLTSIQDVTWSLVPPPGVSFSTASIDENGNLYGGTVPGNYVVKAQAKSGRYVASKVVKITAPESIEIKGMPEVRINSGPINYFAIVSPTGASQNVKWQFEQGITNATFDTEKAILMPNDLPGTVKIHATSILDSSVTATLVVNIITSQPTEVNVSGNETVYMSDSTTYSATVLPGTSAQDVTWSIRDLYDTGSSIDQTGKLTAGTKHTGTVEVIATTTDSTHEPVSGYAEVEIRRPDVTELHISGPTDVEATTTAKYLATSVPYYSSDWVVWSLENNTTDSTIDKDTGILTAGTKVGTVDVVAQSRSIPTITARHTVNISYARATDIFIDGPTTVLADNAFDYTARLEPSYTKQEVTWSCDDSYDNTGTYFSDETHGYLNTGPRSGQVKIIATSTVATKMSVSKFITVVPTKIRIIEITNKITEIDTEATHAFETKITPEASSHKLNWTIKDPDNTGSTIDASTGVFTAGKNTGTVTVTASATDWGSASTSLTFNVKSRYEGKNGYVVVNGVKYTFDDLDWICVTSPEQEITIPNSQIKIPASEFNSPIYLNPTTTLSSIPDNFLAYCSSFNQTLDIPQAFTKIGNNFMYECKAFNRNFVLQSSITSIGTAFMWNCCSMTSTISLTIIGAVEVSKSEYTLANSDPSCEQSTKGVTVLVEEDYLSDFTERFPNSKSEEYCRNINWGKSIWEIYNIEGDDSVYISQDRQYIVRDGDFNNITEKCNLTIIDPDNTSARISSTGMLTPGTSTGKIKIRATEKMFQQVSGEKEVTIKAQDLQSIKIDGPKNVEAGQAVTYNIKTTPIAAVAKAKWTLEDVEGTGSYIDENTGKLTAGSQSGNVIITAKSIVDESITDVLSVNILPAQISHIVILGEEALPTDYSYKYDAYIFPTFAASDIDWSIEDPEELGVTLDWDGSVITTQKTGTFKIVATGRDTLKTRAEKTITVIDPKIDGLPLIPLGGTQQYEFNYWPPTTKQSIWSCDECSAVGTTIDQDGTLHASVAKGYARVKCRLENWPLIQASKLVEVYDPTDFEIFVTGYYKPLYEKFEWDVPTYTKVALAEGDAVYGKLPTKVVFNKQTVGDKLTFNLDIYTGWDIYSIILGGRTPTSLINELWKYKDKSSNSQYSCYMSIDNELTFELKNTLTDERYLFIKFGNDGLLQEYYYSVDGKGQAATTINLHFTYKNE